MYFYHLKLDLYSESTTQITSSPLLRQPQPQPQRQPQDSTINTNSSSSSLEPATDLASRFQSLLKPFPQHIQRAQGASKTLSGASERESSTKVDFTSIQQATEQQDRQRHRHAYCPTDYRFGSITVSSLDESTAPLLPKDKTGPQKHHKSSKNKKMINRPGVPVPAGAGGTATAARFQDAEPVQGILRLYKDTNEITTGNIHIQSSNDGTHEDTMIATAAVTTTAMSSSIVTATHDHDRDGAQVIHPDQGTAVCVLAVPSYMSPGDFLNFVGPVRANVSHFRIIRDSVPNRFMVLMKFRTSKATSEFYAHYNGKAFSSLEPEICHVVYLKSIEIRVGCMPPYAFPFLNEDPFLQNNSPTTLTASATSTSTSPVPAGAPSSMEETTSGSNPNTSQLAQSMTSPSVDNAGLAELPTCPVCLERMDSSVTGLLTILCQHTFHCHCLSKWGEGSCPVCRYSQKSIKKASNTSATTGTTTTGGLTATTDGMTEDQNECALCGTTENLWICLICGHIGCGRYQEKHAYHHYYETSHLYALELETQRVWDYAGDGYVHRLIQNKADGKLVELPSAIDGTVPSQHAVEVGQEKLDAIGLEYTYLLTSQLESQRLYFDAQMAAMSAQLAQMNKEAKDWEKEATLLNQKNRELALAAEALEKEKVPLLIKEKKAVEKRLEKVQEKLQVLERQYEEEKEMNVGLRTNQDSFKEKLQAKEAEILDLQEQVRDMMIYLDTQQRVEASPLKDELVNGTVGVVMAPGGSVPSTSSSSSSSHPRRKGGRR